MISKTGLVNKINNQNISDEEVFKNLDEWLNHYDRPIKEGIFGDLGDIQEVGELIKKVRPKVREMLRLQIIEDHRDCCGPTNRRP